MWVGSIADRGRVWRGMMATPAGNGYVIATSPPQDPALPPQPVVKHNIEAKTMLFAFKDATTADGFQVPFFFLGEFRVAAVAETSLTLEPVIPQTPEQQGVARDQNPIILGPPPETQAPPRGRCMK